MEQTLIVVIQVKYDEGMSVINQVMRDGNVTADRAKTLHNNNKQ